MCKFSIIIAYFNNYATLPDALASVKNTFYNTSYEIIVVNDGSEDNFHEYVSLYSDDRKIRFVEQTNAGVSAARNTGLSLAQGELIIFLDADDELEKHPFEEIFQAFNEGNELVVMGKKTISYDKKQEKNTVPKIQGSKIPKNLINQQIFDYNSIGGEVTNKIFSREIIEKQRLKFKEDINFAEDLVFLIEYLDYIQYIAVLPVIFYKVKLSRNSIRGSVSSPTAKQLIKLSSIVQANEYIQLSALEQHLKDEYATKVFYRFYSLYIKSRAYKDYVLDMEMATYNNKIKQFLKIFIKSKNTDYSIKRKIIGVIRYVICQRY